jgi:hypothetical protein
MVMLSMRPVPGRWDDMPISSVFSLVQANGRIPTPGEDDIKKTGKPA